VEALTARPSPSGADGAEGDGELGALAEGVVLVAHELALVDEDRGQQRDEARGAHAAPHERSKVLVDRVAFHGCCNSSPGNSQLHLKTD
jgi:hypothetical protein